MAIAAQPTVSPRQIGALVDGNPLPGGLEAGCRGPGAAVGAPAGTERPGIIAGLRLEAECLRGRRGAAMPLVCVSGGSARRARDGAEALRAQGARALVSFGLAIGLAPVLRPGDVVIADRVVLPAGGAIATDAAWRSALAARLQGSGLNVRVARIAGSDEALSSAGAKRRAFQSTFAAALDTESHAIAEVAAAAGLPLLVVRAVAEPAETIRPAVAFATVGEDGQARGLALLGRLVRCPWEIPAAWRFNQDTRRALEALRRVAAGPRPFALAAG